MSTIPQGEQEQENWKELNQGQEGCGGLLCRKSFQNIVIKSSFQLKKKKIPQKQLYSPNTAVDHHRNTKTLAHSNFKHKIKPNLETPSVLYTPEACTGEPYNKTELGLDRQHAGFYRNPAPFSAGWEWGTGNGLSLD